MHAKLEQGAIAGNRATRFGSCRLCGAPLATTFVNLGMSPLCESFLPAGEVDRMEAYFPLHALVCGECFLVQLRRVRPTRSYLQ